MFDPQRDTDSFERFRERMQTTDDWEPCEFGCSFEELVSHKLPRHERLFIVQPCNECVDTYMADAYEAAQEAAAEGAFYYDY